MYWDSKMVDEIEREVYSRCIIPPPSFKRYNILDASFSNYVINDFEEEYYTHPDSQILDKLEDVGKLLRRDPEYIPYSKINIVRCTRRIKYYGNAINMAIMEAYTNGGGVVEIPENSIIYTGAIILKSNVYLYIPKTSILRFVRNKNNTCYPLKLSRFEGVDLYNFSPFIYAYNEENIGIYGGGVLDGQADLYNWMPWKFGLFGQKPQDGYNKDGDKYKLFEMDEENIPIEKRVFTDSTSSLRPCFIQPYMTNNIIIKDVKIINSPMWEINPVLCKNVLVDGVNINSKLFNNDGFDPECSTNCILKNSEITTGDDCVAIKGGRYVNSINKPCKNIILMNNKFQDGHGGITLGSDTAGGIYNVYVDNIELNSKDLNYPIRYKSSSKRGGICKNIYIRNITIKNAGVALIHYDFAYDMECDNIYRPLIRNVYVSDVATTSAIKSEYVFYLRGLKYGTFESHYFKNVLLDSTSKKEAFYILNDLESKMLDVGDLDIKFENTKINGVDY